LQIALVTYAVKLLLVLLAQLHAGRRGMAVLLLRQR
jgi:hypothetical protein